MPISGLDHRKTARAWVSFNGTTGAIYSAFNVSSVTRNGAGDYTVNFSSAMPDANYKVDGTTHFYVGPNNIAALNVHSGAASLTTTTVRMRATYGAGTAFDPDYCAVGVYR